MNIPNCEVCASLSVCKYVEEIKSFKNKIYNLDLPPLYEIEQYPISLNINCEVFKEKEE